MSEHALLSASSSNIWLNCPPSIRASEDIPNKTSNYAEEGTLAHALGELLLRLCLKEITKKTYKEKYIELTGNYENPVTDMVGSITNYADFVIERFNEAKKTTPDAKLEIEKRLDFSQWVPDGFGTGDAVIIGDKNIEIIDLKYGKGVPVFAQDNPQLKLYALGAINEYSMLYDIENITTTIYQPRIDNITSATINSKELLDWAENYIKPRATLAFEGKGDFSAGDHCKFCKLLGNCRAKAEENLKLAKYDFQEPPILSNDEIAEILTKLDSFIVWSEAVKCYALEQALKGDKFKGFKIVEGRSTRTYGVENNVIADKLVSEGYNEEQIYTKSILGITSMEKLLGKQHFKDYLGTYIIKPQGKPILVPETDRRLELNSIEQAIQDFKN